MSALAGIFPPLTHRVFRVWQRQFDVWRVYARPFLVGNVVDPIIFIVGMGLGLGGLVTGLGEGTYIEFIAPGALAFMPMYAAAFENTFGSYTRMMVQRTYDAIFMTPVTLEEIVVGEILWAGTMSIIGGLGILVVLVALGLVGSAWVLLTPVVVFLTGLAYGAMGLYYASFAPSYPFMGYFFTIVLTPMLMLSGIFFPLSQLPSTIHAIAWFFPLTHAVVLFRALVWGTVSGDLLWSAIYLLLCAALFAHLAMRRVARKLTP